MPAMLAAALLVLLAGPSPATEVLRIGMDTRSPPWAFVPDLDFSTEDFSAPPRLAPGQLDQIVGVDIEILEALARHLGVKTRIVPTAWAGIEQGLPDKRYDVLMNAWVPSSKTPPGIAASSPYNEWGLVVVVRADNKALTSFGDLAGKVVGHFADPSVDRSVLSLRPGRRVPFDDSDRLFEALVARKLDAAVEDSTYSRWRAAHDRSGIRIVGEPLNRLGYHLGLRREDGALMARLEAAIKQLKSSGDLARIRKRWESADGPGPVSPR
jgi:polar amino acid transport system substrate-binding protein